MIRPLVILPSYNSGGQLVRTMREAAPFCPDVWAVVDGSSDGSGGEAREAASTAVGLRVLVLEKNCGKGGAVLAGLRAADAEGFSHALMMDADGQHAAAAIPEFLDRAAREPEALIAGVPVFGPDAPPERVKGRRIGNFFAAVETWGMGARDSLFGFRVYPIRPTLKILESTRGARRFDFDTIVAVRLLWAGVRAVNLPVPVKYPPPPDGGVTHFRYLRDNVLLTRVHVRLCLEMLLHFPKLVSLRCR